MFPSFVVPAMSAFGSMALNQAKNHLLTHAPEIVDDIFMKGRSTLLNMISRYRKSKTTLKPKMKVPSRTMKIPQRRMRKRLG